MVRVIGSVAALLSLSGVLLPHAAGPASATAAASIAQITTPVFTAGVIAAARDGDPSITAVAVSGTEAVPVVTVRGTGFGALASLGSAQPAGACGGSGSDYQNNFYLSDLTGRWNAGQGPGDCVGVVISSYSDTVVVFSFGSSYADLGENLAEDDAITMTVLGATFSGFAFYPRIGPSVTTTSAPLATADRAYSATLTASGGTAPYTWSKDGGILPPGLKLSPGGVISGTPRAAGAWRLTVKVTDSTTPVRYWALARLSIRVRGLHVTTRALPDGKAGAAYSAQLAAAGGPAPYRWSLARGSLPAGLSLTRDTGRISGTPASADTESTSVITLRVQARRESAAKSLSITIDISPGPVISYRTFAGGRVTLRPWPGRRVAVLVRPGSFGDRRIMTRIVLAFDEAWDFYAAMTGRQPALFRQYRKRDSIAVVTTSCGAACSYLGATGTEINPQYFQALYDGVRTSNVYDQAMFYEFGRNFWFYGSQLAPATTYGDTVTTGYAVFMRFESMNAIGIKGGHYNDTPFPTFERQVWGIAHSYDSDLSKNFANTLAVGQSPSVYGGTDFFASIVDLLAAHYGGHCFIRHFLAAALTRPGISTDNAAVTNFVRAASHAAGAGLGPFFYDYWAFPQPDGTTNPRAPGGIAALPKPSSSSPCPAPTH
jgi:hypothetical protein